MAATEGPTSQSPPGIKRPSEEFMAYCEAEFERRMNSSEAFDETLYRRAMDMVLDRLRQQEEANP